MNDAGMILTIGHSTRAAAEFLSLLQAHGVTGLADVRTFPRSRRHPHFSADALSASLPAHGLEFIHEVEKLLAFAEGRRVVMMCAEAKWWQCHRQLIADALVARGIDVRHILSARDPAPHGLTPFARVAGSAVSYPALV